MAKIDVRLAAELAAAAAAVAAVVFSYHSGAQAERSAMRDDLMATLSVSESVSRYITEMGGYGSAENGRRLMDYRSISSGHDRITPSLKLGDGAESLKLGDSAEAQPSALAQPGSLRMNSTMVSTLIELIQEFDGTPSEKLRRQIIGPIKNLGKSADPTLAGAALTILASTQSAHAERSSFEGAFLQFMLLERLEVSDFNLRGADLRLASITRSTFAACKVAGARFHRAVLQDTTFEVDSCNDATPIALEGVTLDGSSFGVRIAPKSKETSSPQILQLDLSSAEVRNERTPALWCEGSPENELDIRIFMDKISKLSSSRLDHCHLQDLVVPAGASFANSEFSRGSARGARFGAQTLLNARFSTFDLTLSDLSTAGLDYSMASKSFENVDLTDAVVPYEPGTEEELTKSNIRFGRGTMPNPPKLSRHPSDRPA